MDMRLGSLGSFDDKRLEKGGPNYCFGLWKLAFVVSRNWAETELERCGLRAFCGTPR